MSEYQIQQIDKLINTLNKSVRQIEFLEKLDEYMGGASGRASANMGNTKLPQSSAEVRTGTSFPSAVSSNSPTSPTNPGLTQLNPSVKATTAAKKTVTPVAAAKKTVAPVAAAQKTVTTPVAATAPGTVAQRTVAAAAPGTAAPGTVAHIKKKVDDIKQLLSAGTGGKKIEGLGNVTEQASQLKGTIGNFLENLHKQLIDGTNNADILEANEKINQVSNEISQIANVFGDMNMTGGELKQLEYQL